MSTSYISVTDQFCGAGGSSLGAALAGCEVKLAMNHNRLAIETHNTNFPDVDHVRAEMADIDPRRYAKTTILVTSPECTNHTGAKGKKIKGSAQLSLWGKPVDPDAERSRATMRDVVRFAQYHRYEIIMVENVVEVHHWEEFDEWLKAMHRLGYNHKTLYINSMHMAVPQSRDRIYFIFWRKGNLAPNLEFTPLAYCPACDKQVNAIVLWKNQKWGKYKAQYNYVCPDGHGELKPYYRPAMDIIDWSNKGTRIGDRKKPLASKTMARIQRGLDKFGEQPLLVQNYSPGYAIPLDLPTGTITTRDHHSLVAPPFISAYHDRERTHSSIYDPLPTVDTAPRFGLVQPNPDAFISTYYNNGGSHSVSDPTPTVTTREHHALIQPSPRIEDCYFRMLKPHELQAAMAFPDNYKVLGNQSQKIHQLGNATTPPVIQWILQRCVESLQ